MLIEAQNGTIGYSPRPEGGSCFWFELTGEAEAEATAAEVEERRRMEESAAIEPAAIESAAKSSSAENREETTAGT